MSQQEYQRILGEEDAGFYQLTVAEIKRTLDIRPSSSSLDQVRETDQQNFIQAIQLVQQAPELARKSEWMKLGFELFFPTKNPDKYIVSEEELQQQQMQQSMAQAQQGAPAEGMNGSTPYGQPTISPSQLTDLAAKGQIGGQQ